MDEDFVDPNEYYADSENRTTGNHNSGTRTSDEQLYRSVGYVALMIGITIFAYFNWAPDRDQASSIEQDQSSAEISLQSSNRAEFTKPTIASKKMQEITGLSVGVLEERDWAKEEAVAANRSAVADLKAKLDKISSFQNSYSENLVGLKARTEALRTSEEGAKIASDSKFVQQYIALQEKVSELREPSTVADDFVKDMKALLQRIEDSNDFGYAPQSFVVERAEGFLAKSEEQVNVLARFDEAVLNLIEKSKELEPAESLESALRKQVENEENDLAEALATARKNAIESGKIKLAEAEMARVDSETKVEVAKALAKTMNNEALAKEIEDKVRAEEAARIAKLAKEKLEREFAATSTDIQVYLKHLTSDGVTNRGNATGVGPVSYSSIVASGALGEGNDAINNMSRWVGSDGYGVSHLNPRAKNSKTLILEDYMKGTPKYQTSVQFCEKCQQLLRKFGPLMVEKGLLAK